MGSPFRDEPYNYAPSRPRMGLMAFITAIKGTAAPLYFQPLTYEGEPVRDTAAPTVSVSRELAGSSETVTVAAPTATGDRWMTTIPRSANTTISRYEVEWQHHGATWIDTVWTVDRRLVTVAHAHERSTIGGDYDDDEKRLAMLVAEAELATLTVSPDERGQTIPAPARLVRHYDSRTIDIDSPSYYVGWRLNPELQAVSLKVDGAAKSVDLDDYEIVGKEFRRKDRTNLEAGEWTISVVTGYPTTPPDLEEALSTRYVYWLIKPTVKVNPEYGGRVTRPEMPGLFTTGNPKVDAVYRRYKAATMTSVSIGMPVWD